MTEQRKGASLNPKTFVSGGLLDDVDVTFTNVKFEMFDYEGKSDPAPTFSADLVTGTEDGEKPLRQHWSVGSAENWAPAEDGMEIIPIGKDHALRKASNFYMFVQSLLQAGVPESVLESGRVDFMEGLKAHIRRVDAPKRGNLPQGGTRRGRDGKDYEKDNKVLCVEKIYEPYPWEAKKGATGSTAQKSAGPQPTQESGMDVDTKAKVVLSQLIAGNGGKVSKKEIPTKGFLKIKEVLGANDSDINKVLGLMFQDPWMVGNGFAVAADGTITIA